jgi:hypothetical protein
MTLSPLLGGRGGGATKPHSSCTAHPHALSKKRCSCLLCALLRRSAPSSRAHSIDGSSQCGATRYALSRCLSPSTGGGSPSAAVAAAAAAAAPAAVFGHLSMLPLTAAAAAASSRPLLRLQQSRSSSQLSLDGVPCGGGVVASPVGGSSSGSGGGRVSAGGSCGLKHSASYGNLQVCYTWSVHVAVCERRYAEHKNT